jgi:membrane fusion protein (multidrug efflux system)
MHTRNLSQSHRVTSVNRTPRSRRNAASRTIMHLFISRHFSGRTRVLIGVGAVSLLVASGALYAVSRPAKAETKPDVIYELAAADVMTVQAQPMNRTLRLSGTLNPLRHAMIKSHSFGTLIEQRVQEGDRVRARQLLARIDPRNLQAELDARTAALRKAQADLLLATKNRDNSITLLKDKLISQNAFDQTEALYATSVANQEAAQAQVRLSQIALADTEIYAAFDGVVATRNVRVGERVTPDTPLLTLVDLSTMQLEALVPVADVPAIKLGQAARFTVDGFAQREFTGRVERISPQAQQGSRSLIVYLTVTNNDGALKGGMFADGEVVIEQTAPLIALPTRAIHSDDQGHFVLVLKEGLVTRAPIVAGIEMSETGMTVIDSGISDAMQVVIANAPIIRAGVRALLMPKASKA